jgi:hypothetical protein
MAIADVLLRWLRCRLNSGLVQTMQTFLGTSENSASRSVRRVYVNLTAPPNFYCLAIVWCHRHLQSHLLRSGTHNGVRQITGTLNLSHISNAASLHLRFACSNNIKELLKTVSCVLESKLSDQRCSLQLINRRIMFGYQTPRSTTKAGLCKVATRIDTSNSELGA